MVDDRNSLRARTFRREKIGALFSVANGVLLGFVSSLLFRDLDVVKYVVDGMFGWLFSFAGLFAAIYFGMLFHTIVHEGGHLVFGLLTGYRFNSFRIRSVIWQKVNGKIVRKRLTLAGTGGQCLMAPPDPKNGDVPVILYNLGGVFANLIVSVLFLVGFILCPRIPFVSIPLFMFAATGFLSALNNGLPIHKGLIHNDGCNTVACMECAEARRADWLELKVNELLTAGIRLKDMPEAWFEMPSDEAMKNSLVAFRAEAVVDRLMDEGRFAEANAIVQHLLTIDSGLSGLSYYLLVCNRIYLELVGNRNTAEVGRLLDDRQEKFMLRMRQSPLVIRTRYAIALLMERDRAKAESIKAEFLRVAQTYPVQGDLVIEAELMEIARRKELSLTANPCGAAESKTE